jgi:hypothetical protein
LTLLPARPGNDPRAEKDNAGHDHPPPHNNVIVRPRSKTTALIQLDDLTPENLSRITPVAFLTLQTSPRGTKAWVAVNGAPTGFSARLKEGLNADREPTKAQENGEAYALKTVQHAEYAA